MKIPTPPEEIDDKEIIAALARLDAHILINLYANENVVFGRIKPNDKVPATQYLENLGLERFEPFLEFADLNGHHINNGCIVEKDFEERCFELYRDRTDHLFDKIPIDKSFEEDDDIYHYRYGWYEYLKKLYPLFEEIIKTEVKPDLFSAVPEILDKAELQSYYIAASKFVLAIKTRGLRQGGRIDRYIKNMNFISPLIQRLIIKRKGHYYLKNSDINSLDYKLSLLSCFRFMNEDNAKLFELKILQWEENNKHGE